MSPTSSTRPLRLFLDTGVLAQGHFARYTSAHAILILCTQRSRFQALIAEPVAAEFARWLRTKTADLPANEAARLIAGVDGWHLRARPARLPWPSAEELAHHAHLLAAVRHDNDMPAVVAAVLAQPDWVLSTNTRHWNQPLADHTGLQVAHPAAFLARLHP
jgi:hypothetical protein